MAKNELIVKLKDELDRAIKLVVHTRECLENELDSEWAQKKLGIDQAFVKKLQVLTTAFNSLTESKIRLDKAEKAIEREMTPEEDREAVLGYLISLDDLNELSHITAQAKDAILAARKS